MSEALNHLEGEIIAGVKLLRLIGSGGNGVVYLAKHLAMDRIVACKILHADLARNPAYVRDFVREARMAARLEHPNIIQALDVGSSDGIYYLIMEYVPGISLEKIRTSASDRIDMPFLLDIAVSLADAMDYAWKRFHVMHGDIKPDNLLIRDRDNVLKLADLGLAKVAGSENAGGEIMATPLYAAPEVIMGNHAAIGMKSDIYSFGIMLYELLAGGAPFRGTMESVLQQHVDVVPPPLASVNPAVDRELAGCIDSMISKAPVDRPGDWKEIKTVLSGIRKRLSGEKKKKKNFEEVLTEKPDEEKSSQNSVWVWILTGILILTAAGVFWMLRERLF